MKYTQEMKTLGDNAVELLSDKAQRFYHSTAPLHILGYAACDFDGQLFDVRGVIDASGITFDQLNDLLERAADGQFNPL